jgi:hypothetical protein
VLVTIFCCMLGKSLLNELVSWQDVSYPFLLDLLFSVGGQMSYRYTFYIVLSVWDYGFLDVLKYLLLSITSFQSQREVSCGVSRENQWPC